MLFSQYFGFFSSLFFFVRAFEWNQTNTSLYRLNEKRSNPSDNPASLWLHHHILRWAKLCVHYSHRFNISFLVFSNLLRSIGPTWMGLPFRFRLNIIQYTYSQPLQPYWITLRLFNEHSHFVCKDTFFHSFYEIELLIIKTSLLFAWSANISSQPYTYIHILVRSNGVHTKLCNSKYLALFSGNSEICD